MLKPPELASKCSGKPLNKPRMNPRSTLDDCWMTRKWTQNGPRTDLGWCLLLRIIMMISWWSYDHDDMIIMISSWWYEDHDIIRAPFGVHFGVIQGSSKVHLGFIQGLSNVSPDHFEASWLGFRVIFQKKEFLNFEDYTWGGFWGRRFHFS